MKTVHIAKAEPLGKSFSAKELLETDLNIEDVTIIIDKKIPEMDQLVFKEGLDPDQEIYAFYKIHAFTLAQALYRSLPQGVYDQLIIELMQRKVSLYRGLTRS